MVKLNFQHIHKLIKTTRQKFLKTNAQITFDIQNVIST